MSVVWLCHGSFLTLGLFGAVFVAGQSCHGSSLTLRVFSAVLAAGHLPGRIVTIRLSVPLPHLGEIVQMGHVPGLLLS